MIQELHNEIVRWNIQFNQNQNYQILNAMRNVQVESQESENQETEQNENTKDEI